MRTFVLAIAIAVGVGSAGAASAEVRLHRRSYVEERATRVLASLLLFRTVRTVEEEQDRLGVQRERDRLMLGNRAPSLEAGAMGAALLGATIFVTAHAPAALRPLFAGPVHLGPALFEGGGMGAGVGGRF